MKTWLIIGGVFILIVILVAMFGRKNDDEFNGLLIFLFLYLAIGGGIVWHRMNKGNKPPD